MYRLYYDEMSEQFFIGDDIKIEQNLAGLRRRLLYPGGSFTFKEYLKAIGAKNMIPNYKNYRFTRKDFDYPCVFDSYLSYRNGVPTMSVEITSTPSILA